jgi:hypothetical protein
MITPLAQTELFFGSRRQQILSDILQDGELEIDISVKSKDTNTVKNSMKLS